MNEVLTSSATELVKLRVEALKATRRGVLFGMLATPAAAGLRMHGRANIQTLAPGAAWNGTLTDATPPTAVTRTTAKPWCVEMFQNWDTQTGIVTVGFEAGAGGLTTGGQIPTSGVSRVDFYCHGATQSVTKETWTTWTDPNGTIWPEYGWFVNIDAGAIYTRGIAIPGITKPQFSIWATAYPNDSTMQPQLIGPFTFNPRPTRFDGTIRIAPSGGDATDFQTAVAARSAANYERANFEVQNQGALKLNTATTGALTSILTTGIYGITITAKQTAAFTGALSTLSSVVTASISGNVMTVASVTGAALYPGAALADPGNTGYPSTQFPKGARILAQTGGVTGGAGTYTINASLTYPSSSTITAALCILTALAPSSGTIAEGNTLVCPSALPNIVIQPFGTAGTTGTGGAGTYALTAFGPNDALPTAGYTIPIASMRTTVTVTLGDATQSQWAPAFDGIRLEGAGLKWDMIQVGNAPSSSSQILNVSGASYGAICWCGIDSFCGVPTNTSNATGSGSAMLIGGQTPPAWKKSALNTKTPGNNVIPGGNAEAILDWFTIMGGYHHDFYFGFQQIRLAKHTTFARLPQPPLDRHRLAYNLKVLDTSAVAANLRTYYDAFTVFPPAGSTGATFARSGSNGATVGCVATLHSSLGDFTYTISPSTSLTTIYQWINGSVAGDGGVFVTGWSASGFVDTTGRGANHLTLSTLAPSLAIPPTSVTAGGLLLGTIFDVHSDILVFFLPASALPNVDNRASRFIRAYGTVDSAPILSNGTGSNLTDVGVRNFVFQDVSNFVLGAGNQTATNWTGIMSHFVWKDTTIVDLNSTLSVAGGIEMDAYCNFVGNYFDQASYSASSIWFSATFDGSNMMTVTSGVILNPGSVIGPTPSSANGATILPYGTGGGTGTGGAIGKGSIDASGVLTITVNPSVQGAFAVNPNAALTGTGVAANTHITAQLTGTPGGVGTYQTDNNTVVASTTITQPGTGTYQLSQTVTNNPTPVAISVKGISAIVPQANVYRTGSVILGSETTNSKVVSVADSAIFNLVTPLDFSPITSGPAQMANGQYGGALNPDGSWKNAA